MTREALQNHLRLKIAEEEEKTFPAGARPQQHCWAKYEDDRTCDPDLTVTWQWGRQNSPQM